VAATLLFLAAAQQAHAKVVTITWDRNTEPTVIGYRVSYGTQSGTYTTTVNVGNVTSYQVDLALGFRYFAVVRALDSFGQVSPPSNEASVDLTALPPVPPVAPVLTSLSPPSGPIGTPVTIAGSGFGATRGTSTVRFNGTTATPTIWSASSIVVPVPTGATTGAVVVTVGGVASNGLSFTISASPPTITSLSPSSGPAGTSVTIAGANFGATQGTGVVRFNGTVATPSSWSAGSIVVPVPTGATTGPVTVTVGGAVSNSATFTVTTTTPSPVTLTQQQTIQAGGSSASLAFPANNTAGRFIAVAVRAYYINQTISVTDSRGNVYRQAFKFNNVEPGTVENDDTVALFYAENIAGGANTITVSLSRAASLRFAIFEYAGVATSNALDVTRNAAASGASLNSGSATTTAPGDLVMGIFSTQSYRTFTPGAGFTTRASVNAAPNTVLMVADRILATPGSVAATATLSAADIWGAGLAAFRSAAGGGPTNRPPVLTQPTSQAHAENSSVTLALSASDPDGNPLTYSASGLPPALTINPATGVISGTLTFTSAGSYTVTATASDGQLSNSKSFTWTVTNTNRPPTLTQPANQTSVENTTVSLQLAASDPDGTAVTYSASGLPSALSVNATTGLISGTLTLTSAGSYTVTATASDGAASDSKTFNWTVTDAPQGPTITTVSPSSGPIGTSVTIAGANFGATRGASVVRFNGTAATPTNWSSGSIVVPVPGGATTGPVTVTVGGTVSNGVPFTVTTASVPVTLTQQRTIETSGTSGSLAFQANNTAGNFTAVVVRASYLNQTISVADSRGNVYRQAIKFTNAVEAGNTVSLFYAENIAGGANTVTVSTSRSGSLRFAILEYAGLATSNALDVARSATARSTSPSSGSATTTSPGDLVIGVFSTQSNQTVTPGAGFTTRASVGAAPNTMLMVADRIVATPSSVAATATLSSQDNWAAGLIAFRRASSSSPQTETLTMSGSAPVSEAANEAPVVAPLSNQISLRTSSIALPMTATDPEGDPLSYSVSGLPPGLTVDASSGLISGTFTGGSAGHHVVTATVTDGRRSASRTFEWTVVNPAPLGDYDGDGRSDVALYHPANGEWEILPSGSQFASSISSQWGTENDVPVPGDYDGDGRTNVAYYRPSTGQWSVLPSSGQSAAPLEVATGARNKVPVPADYDGDGSTDVGVWDSKTGLWRALLSGTAFTGAWTANLGGRSDVPMAGDYDGDGQADPAVYRPASGVITILLSTTGYGTTVAINSGVSNAKPTPADFDGDGRTDVALFRVSAGSWHILASATNFKTPIVVAAASDADVPLPADHDGDGKADLVVVQSGTWRILRSDSNYREALVLPGAPDRRDISLPATR
jgi:hypothetical protein